MKQLILVFTAIFFVLASNNGWCQSREIHPFVRIGSNHIVHFTKPPAVVPVPRILLRGTEIEVKSTPTVVLGPNTANPTPTPKPTTVTQTVIVRAVANGIDSTILVQPKGVDSVFRPTIHPPLFRLRPFAFHPFTHRGYRAVLSQSHDTLYINYDLFTGPGRITPTDGYPVETVPAPVIGQTATSYPSYAAGTSAATAVPIGIVHPMHFNRTYTYYILVRERLPQVFPFRGFEIGALVVPFQYRPGYHRDTTSAKGVTGTGYVPGQLNVDVNIGLYAGWKFGRVVYRYDRHNPIAPSKYTGSIGPFINVSKVSLDATNTKLSTNRITKDVYRNIASLSAGAALLFDLNDIRAGILLGFDFGVGSDKWDYSGRYWMGFSLGYKLPLFQTSK